MEVNHARESVNAINEVSLPKTYVRLSTNVRGSRMSMSVWHAGWQDNNPPDESTLAHMSTNLSRAVVSRDPASLVSN